MTLAEHHRIRRAVFVDEQRLFDDDDADAYDASPSTVHVLGLVRGEPVEYPQFADGVRAQQVLHGIVESMRTKAWVEV